MLEKNNKTRMNIFPNFTRTNANGGISITLAVCPVKNGAIVNN